MTSVAHHSGSGELRLECLEVRQGTRGIASCPVAGLAHCVDRLSRQHLEAHIGCKGTLVSQVRRAAKVAHPDTRSRVSGDVLWAAPCGSGILMHHLHGPPTPLGSVAAGNVMLQLNAGHVTTPLIYANLHACYLGCMTCGSPRPGGHQSGE